MRPTGTVLQTQRESSRFAAQLKGARSEREDSKRREVRLFHSVLRMRQVEKKKLQVGPGATCDPPTVAYFSLVAAMSAEDRHTFTVHVDSKIRRGG
uniref:Putative 3-hydroxy-3-methylglutaryl-coa hmg-coa reductase n=1 Tax=Ixodes ricinus TaxID=34613 RepID=A0A0K8R735_IXORI